MLLVLYPPKADKALEVSDKMKKKKDSLNRGFCTNNKDLNRVSAGCCFNSFFKAMIDSCDEIRETFYGEDCYL
jgi:hypothetical protein